MALAAFIVLPVIVLGIYFVAKRIGFSMGFSILFGFLGLLPGAILVIPFVLAFAPTSSTPANQQDNV